MGGPSLLGQLPRVTNHSNCVTLTSEHISIPSNKASDSICSYKGMGPKGISFPFPYSSLCKTGSLDVCWFPNLPINSRNIILAKDFFFHSVYYLLITNIPLGHCFSIQSPWVFYIFYDWLSVNPG